MRLLGRTTLVVAIGAITLWARPAAAQAAPSLTGKWEFSVVTENGTGTPGVVFTQQVDSLTGTYQSARGGVRKLDGVVKGKAITFTVRANDGAGVDYKFQGVIEADGSLKGTADFSGMGAATFTARRLE